MKKCEQTVLLVEDDENDVFLFQEALRAADLEVRLCVAVDGQEAIDYLSGKRQYHDRSRFPMPVLVFLDLKLPRVMGLDVLRWIRGQSWLCGLTVIVFSSSGLSRDVEEASRLGANSFVVKPLTHEERISLAGAIRDYWFEWHCSPSDLQPDTCVALHE